MQVSQYVFIFLYDHNERMVVWPQLDDGLDMVNGFDTYFKIFDQEIEIDDIITQNLEYLKEFYDEGLSIVLDWTINRDRFNFIHLTSVGNKNTFSRRGQ